MRARIVLGIAFITVLWSLTGVNAASATPMGTLALVNCGGGGLTITNTSITWLPNGTIAGTGCADTAPLTNITWSGGTVGAGATANIRNITAGGGPLDHFIDILGAAPVLDFTLDLLGPAAPTNGTACAGLTAGQSCVPATGSPILLVDDGANTIFKLRASGVVTDGVAPGSEWGGVFMSELNMTPVQFQTVLL